MQNALSALLSLPSETKEKKGLKHTPQEIHQQPKTWLETGRKLQAVDSDLRDFLRSSEIGADESRRPRVILTGAGTSDFVGGALSALLRERWRCEVEAIPSTDLLVSMDEVIRPDKKYLMVSFSRSGDSSEGVAVLARALSNYPGNIRHLVITCNANGKMAKFDRPLALVLDESVNDRGLAMTSSFSNMLVAGQYLATIYDRGFYQPHLSQMAMVAQNFMPIAANAASELAKRNFSRMCFLGAGPLKAVAGESALKVLELNSGLVATLAESPLGVRHGPLSFVNHDTLVVIYLSGDEYRVQYELDLIEEILRKQLAADVVVIAPRMSDRLSKLRKTVLSLEAPDFFPDFYRPPIDVIFGQLLGLFTSIENDITPDSPSQGAIDRVVTQVNIYSASEEHNALHSIPMDADDRDNR